METNKNSKNSKQQPLNEKSFYDLIQPEQLELLYKKNAHLLDRLSKTGRENTLLHIKLSSLNKEKKKLGNKTAVLKNKHSLLKNQISLFARQHRKFNSQSKRLKAQLEQAHKLKEQTTEDPSLLSALKEENQALKEKLLSHKTESQQLNVLRKKEQVLIKQITRLQEQLKEAEIEKKQSLQPPPPSSSPNQKALIQSLKETNQASHNS